MKKDFIQSIKIITLGLVIGLSVGSLFAWTNPTGTPQNSNSDAPIFTSSTAGTPSYGLDAQVKGGGSAANGVSLAINGALSALSLSVTANATIAGNLQVYGLNKANNSGIASWPAPVCVDATGNWTLCTAPPPPTYLLTVTTIGTGTGTINATYHVGGALIGNCTTSCTYSLPPGTVVDLTATPSTIPNSTFIAWGGTCTGNTCSAQVTMNAPQSVTAKFDLTSRGNNCVINTTTPATGVTGTTAVIGGNIVDPGGTTAQIPLGARGVRYGLTAPAYGTDVMDNSSGGAGAYTIPISGLSLSTTYHYQAFASNDIGGSCTGADQTFTTTNTATVKTLAVTITGTGSGGVTSTPSGIFCGKGTPPPTSPCSKTFAVGSSVTLHASAMSGSTFVPWTTSSGCNSINGSTGDCNVTMTTDKTIVATFNGPNVPTVTTTPASVIGSTTATVGGNVTSGGGATVTDRGIS